MSARRPVAVVTGASTGIGREIALALARQGWDVAFTFVGPGDDAEAVQALIVGGGADCLASRCDAGNKAEVDEFYQAIAEWAGAPDLLVNNAGVQTWAPLLELDEASWDRVIRTNLKGCFLNTQSAARLMVQAQKPGSIVNIGSGCNKLAFPRLVDYSASKGGIEVFTKVAAIELGPFGIRVNCVAPGAIETERTQAEAQDYAETWAAMTPLGRVGTPGDIADVILYLATPGASFITGQTIGVDGGAFSKPAWPY
jgi:3-oxoacyl-[acyl-carrier protein] reductase